MLKNNCQSRTVAVITRFVNGTRRFVSLNPDTSEHGELACWPSKVISDDHDNSAAGQLLVRYAPTRNIRQLLSATPLPFSTI